MGTGGRGVRARKEEGWNEFFARRTAGEKRMNRSIARGARRPPRTIAALFRIMTAVAPSPYSASAMPYASAASALSGAS